MKRKSILNQTVEMEGDQVSSKEVLKKVIGVISNYRLLVILSIVLAAVTGILQRYVPVLFGDAIDEIISSGKLDLASVARVLTEILVLVAAAGAATYVMNLINNRITYRTVQEIRAKAIRQIQCLPLKYLDGHSTGDLVSRVIADADQLSDGLLLGFTQLFSGVITILVTLIFMFRKSLEVSLLVVVLTPLSFFVARFIATHSYTMFRKQSETRGAETALIEEMISGARVVKAFGYEQRSSERFEKINEELRVYSQKAIFYSSLTNPSTRFVNSVIYAAVALLGSYRILDGRLTVGGLSVLLNYSNQYMKPFNDISSVVTELQNAMACAARIFALIDEAPEKDAIPLEGETETLPDLPAAKGTVDIDNVYFSYVPNQKLIEHYTLHAEPGMRIAIVGPTGCGKTTMINLLMRFYDADHGDIRVDGKSIYQVNRRSLRRNYGMVLQETWLKNTTVRENIRFGKPDASDEEIIHACKEARSWDFIRRLPEGLDTVLKDDGLSQGQKQLLCITRVMLCLPPMLILDEATSSIDTRTELLVQNAFDKLMTGRTSFVVAHRLSTIRNADLILVMKDGKIIEQGTHDSLMAENGFYTSLYNSQFARVN